MRETTRPFSPMPALPRRRLDPAQPADDADRTGYGHTLGETGMHDLAAVLLAASAVAAGASAGQDPLEDHRWRHRVLLLYVPGPDTPALESFHEQLRARDCGVHDRDPVIGEIVGRSGGSVGGRPLAGDEVRRLREQHGVETEHVVTVLVGKDGGVKARADGVADLGAIFERIDSMPMRRREMAGRESDPCR